MVPRVTFLSRLTVTPGSAAPVPSTKVAVSVVEPPIGITGAVVDRFSFAIGAGGPTARVISLIVLAFEAPLAATAVRTTWPWIKGTVHETPT